MKKAIITVLLGNYDNLKPAPKFKDWDAILVTDKHYPNTLGWTIHKVKSENPAHDSRYYKWLTHLIFPSYNLVCYVDASITLKKEPPIVETWFSHPRRKKLKTEAIQIIKLKKAPIETVELQLAEYKKAGFKDNNGLYQNGFFVRKQDTQTNKLCEEVYTQTTKFTNRDQLAMPFALFKLNQKLNNVLPGKEAYNYIKITPHQNTTPIQLNIKKKMPIKILPEINPVVHHITPGRSDLNYGKSINDIIKSLPDTDWICLRDIDTVPAYHEEFFKQCEEIASSGEFALVGCITNRLGLRYQLHEEKISSDTNWLNHRLIAKERFKKYKTEVTPTDQTLAGLFMLFPKSVWQKVGGFLEGSIKIKGSFIDFHFSEAVKKEGFKLGIAQGIYLIHLYRPDAKIPRLEYKHLITKTN